MVSQEKPHRLAWLLNKLYPYKFIRVDDYEIDINSKPCSFSQFIFEDEENHTQLIMLANKDDSSFLIPELKNFDYLILVKGAIDYFEGELLKSNIKTIPSIQIIFQVETNSIKSKQNLIYV
jgi:hypothetical protein